MAGNSSARENAGEVSSLALIAAVEQGFCVTELERLAKAVAPNDTNFKYRIVRKATLTRRIRSAGATMVTKEKKTGGDWTKIVPVLATDKVSKAPTAGRLSPEESARVARLRKVWKNALKVWGNENSARAFLFRPHPLLEGRLPIDVVLTTEFGGPAVEDILGRLQFGSAA